MRENLEKKPKQQISLRIPKDLYVAYKKVLLDEGAIVTGDIIRYMQKKVDEHKNKP